MSKYRTLSIGIFLFAATCVQAWTTAAAPQEVGKLLGSATTDQVFTPVTPCRFVNGINAQDRVVAPGNGTTTRYYKVRGSNSTDFVLIMSPRFSRLA